MSEITVDIAQFIVSVPEAKIKESVQNTQYPAALLFLLNHFAKQLVSQLAQEASVDTSMAEPVGIATATIFAAPEFRFNGISLIDLVWAKYHKVCPVLFGISGPESTSAGKQRVGWLNGIDAKEHVDRMRGFGAGFASITLRDFSKSVNSNPAPNHLFWTSLARILNTPPNERVSTQYVVTYNMLEHSVPRFVGFYGSAAITALKKATGDFPANGVRNAEGKLNSRATILMTLPSTWEKSLGFTL